MKAGVERGRAGVMGAPSSNAACETQSQAAANWSAMN